MGSNNSSPQFTPQVKYNPRSRSTVYVHAIASCPTGPTPATYEVSAEDLYPTLGAPGWQDDDDTSEHTPRNMAKEVVHCSVLLRQMFALDLDIWGKSGCVESELAQREELKCKADILFAAIRWRVYGLRSMADVLGSAYEKRQIRDICRVLDEHESPRYVS